MMLNQKIATREIVLRAEFFQMRIGVLTGGGDCPGLNAAIRAIVRCATRDGVTVLGIRNGYRGLVENDIEELTRDKVIGILPRGGTILGTSRFNPLKDEVSLSALKENFASHRSEERRVGKECRSRWSPYE